MIEIATDLFASVPCATLPSMPILTSLIWESRLDGYFKTTGFPRSLFIGEDGRVYGTWIMGNDYRVKSTY